MKRLLITFGICFLLIACGDTNLSPLDNEEPPLAQPSVIVPPYQEKIQDLVEEDEQKAKQVVGGKKRRGLEIANNVGGKDLDGRGQGVSAPPSWEDGPALDAAPLPEDPAGPRTPSPPSQPPSSPPSQASSDEGDSGRGTVRVALNLRDEGSSGLNPIIDKKTDMLFYVEDRRSSCLQNFRRFVMGNGFLSHLSQMGLDWQAGISLFSESEANLLPIESMVAGPVNTSKDLFSPQWEYLLSKSGHQANADNLLVPTLSPRDSGCYGKHGCPGSVHTEDPIRLNFREYNQNPLSGLDKVLSGRAEEVVRRQGAHLFVFVFNKWGFPYYSKMDWRRFFNKHQNMSIIMVSSRRANISNLTHVISRSRRSQIDLRFVPACDRVESGARLISAVQDKLN